MCVCYSYCLLVEAAAHDRLVPDALKLQPATDTVRTANATATVSAPVPGVALVLGNASLAGEWDVFFAAAHPHASPAFPAVGTQSRRNWRRADETGIFVDETPLFADMSADAVVSVAYLRHNINGYWKCPALEEMTFAIRQTFVPAPGSTAEAPLTHLKLSAELLGADQVKAKDVEDVNQVLQQLEDIFAQHAETVKAYAEARHAGTAYNRPHEYKANGYLCE